MANEFVIIKDYGDLMLLINAIITIKIAIIGLIIIMVIIAYFY